MSFCLIYLSLVVLRVFLYGYAVKENFAFMLKR